MTILHAALAAAFFTLSFFHPRPQTVRVVAYAFTAGIFIDSIGLEHDTYFQSIAAVDALVMLVFVLTQAGWPLIAAFAASSLLNFGIVVEPTYFLYHAYEWLTTAIDIAVIGAILHTQIKYTPSPKPS